MRGKNKGTARRMLLPRSNPTESRRSSTRDRLSHECRGIRSAAMGDTQRPDAKHPASTECHESSWDSVARPMITWRQIAERTAIADARSSRGAAKFISPARKRWVFEKIKPKSRRGDTNSRSGHVQSVCRTAVQHFHHICLPVRHLLGRADVPLLK